MNFIKMKDACEKLGVGSRTIFNYIKKGMPAYKLGNTWRFDETEIIEWVKKEFSK